MCEKNSVENWFGSFCPECRQIKNLGNVYGFDRILEILKKCCIRDENQLEKKIDSHKRSKSVSDESYETKPSIRSSSVATRSQKKA